MTRRVSGAAGSAVDEADRRSELLRLAGRPVAEYVWRPDLPLALAPRPYLHPVRTLAGTVVTEVMPPSHRHHLGLSIAVAEVDGSNFWGGRTYLAGHGPAWLDNHGTQEHLRWVSRSDTELCHLVRWRAADGRALLVERRGVSCRQVSDRAWALEVTFALTNARDHPVEISSPAGRGRAGAGYGGFFWRAPAGARQSRVFTPDGSGAAAVHGVRSDWLALTARAADGRHWTLVFLGATMDTRSDPWFVRTRDYLGVGSAIAWDTPLVLAPGRGAGADAATRPEHGPAGEFARRIATLVVDGELTRDEAARLAAECTS